MAAMSPPCAVKRCSFGRRPDSLATNRSGTARRWMNIDRARHVAPPILAATSWTPSSTGSPRRRTRRSVFLSTEVHCRRDPLWKARIAELEGQRDAEGRARALTLAADLTETLPESPSRRPPRAP
jgi:hypothetical protein